MELQTLQDRIDAKAKAEAEKEIVAICKQVNDGLRRLTGRDASGWDEEDQQAFKLMASIWTGSFQHHVTTDDFPHLLETKRAEVAKQVMDAVDQVQDILRTQEAP